MMQYASTIGNHDFDNGIEGLRTNTHANLNLFRPIMILKIRYGWICKTI
jgi:2',3'-cyclic-nucleotide 2'-phosphodiesterase (5'-nucleotidase family)